METENTADKSTKETVENASDVLFLLVRDSFQSTVSSSMRAKESRRTRYGTVIYGERPPAARESSRDQYPLSKIAQHVPTEGEREKQRTLTDEGTLDKRSQKSALIVP